MEKETPAKNVWLRWGTKSFRKHTGAASAEAYIFGSYVPPKHAIRRPFAVVIMPDLPRSNIGESPQVIEMVILGYTYS